ncbi:MAG: hypothetical protein KDA24_26770 [Deltaproteobacteria bacterium]|nr:hypothetical protein [Deltaproteobacteria bacterium]
MTRIPTLALLAAATSLAALSGCALPLDSGSTSVEDQASWAVAGPSIPSFDAPENLSLQGEVRTLDGVGLGEGTVCILGSDVCQDTELDGAFAIDGLEEGVSEMLRVEVEGYISVIVPVENSGAARFLDVEMVPLDGAQFDPETGGVRLMSRSYGQLDHRPVLVRLDEVAMGGDVRIDRFADVNIVPIGEYALEKLPVPVGQQCSFLGAWTGPGQDLVIPVVAGAITHIQQDCIQQD